jgi:hypothetical protein
MVASRKYILDVLSALDKGYSPECVEGKFCELRLEVILRKLARLTFASTLLSGTRDTLPGHV